MEAGLTMADIGAMSPGELDDFCEAQLKREMREWDRIAYMTAHLMNCFRSKGAKHIKPSDLLGRPMLTERKKPLKLTKDEIEKEKRILRKAGVSPRSPKDGNRPR